MLVTKMALKVFTDNLSCIVTHFVQTKYSGMMLRTSQNQRSCGITSRCLCRTMDQRLCCSRTMPVFMLPERCRMNLGQKHRHRSLFSFPLSLGLLMIMLSLLALLTFFWLEFKEWSTVPSASSAHLQNLHRSLI